MICSDVCLVRFMVESPAQSGRLKTLIHPGPVSGVHVRILSSQAHGPTDALLRLLVLQSPVQAKLQDGVVALWTVGMCP